MTRRFGWAAIRSCRIKSILFFLVFSLFLLCPFLLYTGSDDLQSESNRFNSYAPPQLKDIPLKDLLAGRPCPACRSYSRRPPACPLCSNLTDKDIRAAHPSVFSWTGIDCRALFDGDQRVLAKAKDFMWTHERVTWSEQDYVDKTRNCSEFRRTRGYPSQARSREEADFPIAFSILAYRDAQQVERLLRAIYAPQNFYCLHVDAKATPLTQRALTALASCFDNVLLASRPVSVYWGHISIVSAEMSCMEDLLRFDWKYFINLSGQMFPAHSNAELVKILKMYNGANDIEGSIKQAKRSDLKIRLTMRWHLSEWLGLMVMLPLFKESPPLNVTIYKGTNQIAATRQFVLYFLYHPSSRQLLEFFQDAYVPDEYIWPTLNHNQHLHAPGGYKGNADTKPCIARATIWQANSPWFSWPWQSSPSSACQGKWVRQICIFGVGDLPWLRRRRELFINKFHSDFEWLTFDCMEELIFNRTIDGDTVGFEPDYYLEFPFIKERSLVVSVNETLRFL